MHILLSEAIGFLSVPSNVSASLAVISLLLIAIRLRIGGFVAAVPLATLALAALSNALLTPLEQRFREMKYPDERTTTS
jgi:hypothetical protein